MESKVKLTLLEIVQSIMSDMDSDNVNSIDDTVESQQVALIVKDCYLNLIANRNWHNQQTAFQMEDVSDITRPNYLKSPEDLKELITFRYNCRKADSDRDEWKVIKHLDPEEFLNMVSRRNSSAENCSVITDYSGTYFTIYNNRPPEFWTTFDDEYIVCDAWDSRVDNTLHSAKTQCVGYILKPFVMENDAYPPLPVEAYPALIQNAKSQAFLALKQVANEKAETEAQKQNSWLARKNWKLHGGIKYPNYGRRRMK